MSAKFFTKFAIILYLHTSLAQQKLFPLTIVHLNDFQSRYEETNMQSNSCKNKNECIGGYARVVSMVKELNKTSQNMIYLNVGDNFEGTFYHILFRWNITQYFLNLLPADAITIGNHEFDYGIEDLASFLEAIKSPVVVCNLDDSLEPSLHGKYTKSTVLIRDGREIGVVGVTTRERTGDWGNIEILPEIKHVRVEVDKLTSQGIKIIVVLSHCGLLVDLEMARIGGKIDIIVGGHSHSFLYTGSDHKGPDTPVGEYPTIVKQDDGRTVLIVQASAFTKYLGNITLFFNDDGEVEKFDGSPIFLSHDIPQDEEIVEKLRPWKAEVDKFQNRKIGKIRFPLDNADCDRKECTMGDFLTDMMVYSVRLSILNLSIFTKILFLGIEICK